jgi:hypothetical protein
MTHDHIDAFSDALDTEKRGYLICVHDGLHIKNSGAHIRSDLDNWPEPGKGDERSKSKAHDVLLAIAAALSENGERFEVVRHEERA